MSTEFTPVDSPNIVGTIFAVAAASAVRGALGAIYFAVDVNNICPCPLYVLDWDLQAVQSALPTYLTHVFARLEALRAGCKTVLYPEDIALYAEPKGLGNVVLMEAHKGGYDVREIRADIFERDLRERAEAALPYAYSAQIRLTKEAYEKVLNFRGSTANHLREQIGGYSIDQRADDAELMTAWCNAILQALETGTGW